MGTCGPAPTGPLRSHTQQTLSRSCSRVGAGGWGPEAFTYQLPAPRWLGGAPGASERQVHLSKAERGCWRGQVSGCLSPYVGGGGTQVSLGGAQEATPDRGNQDLNQRRGEGATELSRVFSDIDTSSSAPGGQEVRTGSPERLCVRHASPNSRV